MADDIRKAIDVVNALNSIMLGSSMVNQGATPDSSAPNFVKEDADPELCKEALERLSRHLIEEIQALVREDERFTQVFNLGGKHA